MKKINIILPAIIFASSACTFNQKETPPDISLDTTVPKEPTGSNAIYVDTSVTPEKKIRKVPPQNKIPEPTLDTISVH